MAFDVHGARQAGYSDAEIAGFLAQQNSGFDVQGALQSGYNESEVVDFLANQPAKSAGGESPLSRSMRELGVRETYMQPDTSAPGFMQNPVSGVSPKSIPSRMAGAGTQAVASLPTDPAERAAYYASQRFPDDPNAIGRYGLQDGRIFYMGDDGNTYFEEPEFSITEPGTWGKTVASSVGPGLAVAGGIAGGVATAPAGGIPGAGLGAALGDEMRQGLAMTFAGQKDFNPLQTAEEAGTAALGQGIGAGVTKLFRAPIGTRGSARDIAKIQNKASQQEIQALQQKAADTGIQLTPAEITNLKSLRAQQNVLGDLPASSDIMADFYARRNAEQVPAAFDEFARGLSPVESVEMGAQSLQRGAKSAVETEAAERAAKARPFYQKAANVEISPEAYESLNSNPLIRQQMKAVMRDPKYQADLGELFPQAVSPETGAFDANLIPVKKIDPTGKVGFYDIVKRRIGGLIDEAERKGNRNDVRIYTNAKKKLLNVLDDASPDYRQARALFEEGSPPVTALTKGEVGAAAQLSPLQMNRVTKIIFDSGPMTIRQNRAAFAKAGKEQEWNDGLRAYLQENFDKAAQEYIGGNANPGMRFRKAVFGTGKQKQAMMAAMSPEQWRGFSRLMDVLEATGRSQQGGSRTAFAKEGIEQLKQEAGGLGSKVIRAANPSNVLDTARIARAWEQMRLGQHSEKLAEIITSPEGMKQLAALKAIPPNSIKARQAVAQILAQWGMGEAIQPQDVPAGGFSGARSNQKGAR